MIELSVIRDLVAIFGVLAGFSYYVLTVRANQRNQQMTLETRQAQVYMQILNQFNNPERQKAQVEVFSWEWKDPEDFDKRIWSNEEKKAKFIYYSMLFEGIGILVNKKFIDIELIDDLISSVVISYWEKFGSIEVYFREKYHAPQNAEWIEYLYNKVVKITLNQHPELSGKTSTVWRTTP